MGDPSSLRFVPVSEADTPIDWSRVPEVTKKYFRGRYMQNWDEKDPKPLPATIGDLAKVFDGTKFFGYFEPNTLTILMDISEFGLQPKPSNGLDPPIGPRFYMRYCEQVWILLFAPGTKNCIVGYSDDIIWDTNDDEDDDEMWEKMAAQETMIAQAFDAKLEQETLQGGGEKVESTNTLGGWTAWTLPYLDSSPRLWF